MSMITTEPAQADWRPRVTVWSPTATDTTLNPPEGTGGNSRDSAILSGKLTLVTAQIDNTLARRLPLAVSLCEETQHAHQNLPSRVAEDAVIQHLDEYAAEITARCVAGFRAVPADFVWMPKANLKYRPLAALPLAERTLFRGLAGELVRTVNDLDAFVDMRDTFETTLLDDPRSFTHFGMADVASFYRYIPHSLLHQRLVEATGQIQLAEGVRAFLRETMGADVGLPQGIGPSDLFADLLILPVERRLARKGIQVTRYNDDFRIAGMSGRAVRHGLEELQRELYAIGLTLNDAKTAILRRESYMERARQSVQARTDEAQINDQHSAEEVAEALSLLRSGLAFADSRRAPWRQTKAMNDTRYAIRRLIRWGDASALEHGQAIINRHPRLTQVYSRYCAKLVAVGHGDQVAGYLDRVFPRLVLTEWQELWLLEPLIDGARPSGGRLQAWLKSRLGPNIPSVLRARAALASAQAGLLRPDAARLIVEDVSEVAKPDAILAFSLLSDRPPRAERILTRLPDCLLATWVYGG